MTKGVWNGGWSAVVGATIAGTLVAACSSGGSRAVDSATESAQGSPAPGGTTLSGPAEPEPASGGVQPSGSAEGASPASAEAMSPDIELTQPSTPSDATEPPAAEPTEPGRPAAVPTPGCGSTEAVASGRFDIDVGDLTREYILRVPDSYDANRPYPIVFAWHPWGGSAQQVAQGFGGGFHGLANVAGDAVVLVSPEGLPFGDNGLGWGNPGGRDINFMNAMLARFGEQLCLDESRVFSTGFSFGGMMSFALGCGAADVVRAIAPMAGNATASGCEDADRPVALLGFIGLQDTLLQGSRAARDIILENNGCSQESTLLETSWCNEAGAGAQPCSCVSYQGCQAGYPATWCEFTGPHTPAPNAGRVLWEFFSQF